MKKILKSEKEMDKFAACVAKRLKPGDVLALQGDLGSGKTTFTKGLAKAVGVKKSIQSPTFVLLRPYDTGKKIAKEKCIKILVHVDAYRIDDPGELLDIGLAEFIDDPGAIVVIEWADKIKKILPRGRTKWIKFKLGTSLNERIVETKD